MARGAPGGGEAAGKVAGLEAWLAEAGMHMAECVCLCEAAPGCSGLALGVRATRDVAQGERLCTIPKAACISIRTTELADIIEEEELGGGKHGYLAALPRPHEYLPVLWSAEQLEELRGTELEARVAADQQLMEADFEEHILPLLARHPGRLDARGITLGAFHTAASYVASRAFGIDAYHGDAMVPLADIFNHKCSVVELDPAYAVHGQEEDGSSSEDGEEEGGSDSEEAEEEDGSSGEDGEAERGSGSEEAEEEGGSSGGEGEGDGEAAGGGGHRRGCSEAACGACNGHGHGPQQDQQQKGQGEEEAPGALPAVMSSSGKEHSRLGISRASSLHLRLEMAIVDRGEELEIVAASAVPTGAEVHNTYGEHGNDELVAKYGFALRENPFTAVRVGKAALLAAAEAALGRRRCRARCRFLRHHTQVLATDEDGDEVEPFEVLPNGHLSPALFVALRVLSAPDAEADAWQGIGDALTPPGAVEAPRRVQPVQLWPVLDADGRRRPAAGGERSGKQAKKRARGPAITGADGAAVDATEAGADMAAAAAEGIGQEETKDEGSSLAQLINRLLCELVIGTAQARLAAYPTPLRQSLALLGAVQRDAASAAAGLSEAQAAALAALTLRVTEQEVLDGLIEAAWVRLRALEGAGSAAGGKSAAEEQRAAAGKRTGRGKQRGSKRKARS
eukprot:scaffold4.g4898.t1